MLLLAIEQSSPAAGVAVLDNGKILGAREWDGLALRSSGLFSSLQDLLADLKVKLEDISGYIVDVGPGSYSGLRSSLAAVRAFALPEAQPIYALTSAETLAFEIIEKYAADKVQVVGDARRRQWWTALYKRNGSIPVPQSKIQLVPENDFRPAKGAVVVSADWSRLADKLKNFAGAGARLIEEPRAPQAGYLGQLAYQKMQLNIPSEPLSPIYLHAAVGGGPRDS